MYRRAGFQAEQFITGSARKRYDRAKKIEPAILISLDLRDGVRSHSLNLLDQGYERVGDVTSAFDSFYIG